MKKRATLRIVAILCVLTLLGVLVSAKEKTAGELAYDRMEEAGKFLVDTHINATPGEDPIKHWLVALFDEDPTLADTFINSMFQSFDRYSYYLPIETHNEAFDTSKSTVGIGASLALNDQKSIEVTSTNVGGPADKGGVQPGDIILAIDGKSIAQYSLRMVNDLLRGEAGTNVVLRVLRDGKEVTCTVTRAIVPLSTVSARNHGGGVGYIRIASFDGSSTFMDFTLTYDQFPGLRLDTVIIDLRDNLGGDLNSVINCLNYVIPDHDIPYLRLRMAAPAASRTCTSNGLGPEMNKILIVVNENTASAAELFAGVLRDLGYAEIVGQTTYGKGYAQSHYETGDGHYAVVSTTELLLPKTGSYDGKGLTPDFPISLYTAKYRGPTLAPLNLKVGITPSSDVNVLGVEQRLSQLGYFEFTPDKIADFRTFHATGQFQKANELPVTDGKCDAATVRAIDKAMQVRIATPVVMDTQFQKALILARAYHARGETIPTPDKTTLTFGE